MHVKCTTVASMMPYRHMEEGGGLFSGKWNTTNKMLLPPPHSQFPKVRMEMGKGFKMQERTQ